MREYEFLSVSWWSIVTGRAWRTLFLYCARPGFVPENKFDRNSVEFLFESTFHESRKPNQGNSRNPRPSQFSQQSGNWSFSLRHEGKAPTPLTRKSFRTYSILELELIEMKEKLQGCSDHFTFGKSLPPCNKGVRITSLSGWSRVGYRVVSRGFGQDTGNGIRPLLETDGIGYDPSWKPPG
jgi:hypothetical protein